MAVGRSRPSPLLCYPAAVMEHQPLGIGEHVKNFGALGFILALVAAAALIGIAVLLWAMRTVF
jgi:hypothetical protein